MLSTTEGLRDLETKEALSVVNVFSNKNRAGERAGMPVLRRSSVIPKRSTYSLVRSLGNNWKQNGVATEGNTPLWLLPSSAKLKSYLPLHSKSASVLKEKKILGFAQVSKGSLTHRKANFVNPSLLFTFYVFRLTSHFLRLTFLRSYVLTF